jgi:hypothetical protein
VITPEWIAVPPATCLIEPPVQLHVCAVPELAIAVSVSLLVSAEEDLFRTRIV